jgi:hypothetical protein
VLAEMWHTGELDRNFIVIHTSSGTLENIIGDCNGYKFCISWVRDNTVFAPSTFRKYSNSKVKDLLRIAVGHTKTF